MLEEAYEFVSVRLNPRRVSLVFVHIREEILVLKLMLIAPGIRELLRITPVQMDFSAFIVHREG